VNTVTAITTHATHSRICFVCFARKSFEFEAPDEWLATQLSLFVHGGQPYTVVASANTSGNGENADRANLVGNPYAGVSTDRRRRGHLVQSAAFVDRRLASTARRDAVSFTIPDIRRGICPCSKHPITERINAQFRVEMFNLFNRTNYAPVGAPQAGESAVIGSTIGPLTARPHGPGEPFNTQFALKITF